MWFFHFYFALSRQLVMKTNQVGIRNSIRIYVSHVLSTKTGTQICVNWVIRYIMQDVGLKYLHLSTDYETNIQSLIEACERHMAKETKEIKCIDKELVNQNQILSKKRNITPNLTSFHSKIHFKTPLHGSTPRLHSMAPLHKLHSAEIMSKMFENINKSNFVAKYLKENAYRTI